MTILLDGGEGGGVVVGKSIDESASAVMVADELWKESTSFSGSDSSASSAAA